MTAEILTLTESQYRADPMPVPSLSKSIAHTLVTKSPLHAWLEHPRLGGQPKPATDATDNGTLFHKLLLGKGPEIEVIHADSYRTKAAQEARDAALAAGKLPMKVGDYEPTMTACEAIRANLKRAGFVFTGGRAEVPIQWYEDGAEGPVLCRSMPDWLPGEEFTGVCVELKTARSAHPRAVQRAIMDFGYDIQGGAAYPRALGKLYPEWEGRIDFQFVFFETEPPYAVLPVRLSGAFREYGLRRWMRAVSIWERCLATNTWPGYAEDFVTIEPPGWALTEELMNE